MQLIFETESETCINTNMALINKDSINEKFSENIVEKLNSLIQNGNKEKPEDHSDIATENSLITGDKEGSKNAEHASEETNHKLDNGTSDTPQESSHNNINNIEQIEDISSPKQTETDLKSDQIDCVKETHVENGTNDPIENNTEESELTESEEGALNSSTNNDTEKSVEKINQHSTESKLLDQNGKDKDLPETLNSHSSKELSNDIDCVQTSKSNNMCCSSSETKEENTLTITSNDMEVDEKNEEADKEEVRNEPGVENLGKDGDQIDDCQLVNTMTDEKIETSHEDTGLNASKEDIIDKNDMSTDEIIKIEDKTEQIREASIDNSTEKGTDVCETGSNIKSALDESEAKIVNSSCDDVNKSKKALCPTTEEKTPKPLRKSKINLDILSDDEDTPSDTKSADVKNETNKQCIDIEDDDDDIMLIDDISTMVQEKVDATVIEKNPEDDLASDVQKEPAVLDKKSDEKIDVASTVVKDSPNNEDATNVKQIDEDIKEEKSINVQSQSPKPLLPKNFVSTCKKNLAEMTRNELEEFCILKIVESVVDRGNLGEIKTQLKNMAQNIEAYKNKAKVLTKQNHALQVVLRSVQEELKKNTNRPIIPLKISRSVGIQVLMPDKIKRKSMNSNTSTGNVTSASPASKLIRTPPPLVTRSVKSDAVGQQIPVPRLIPASSGVKSNSSSPNQTIKPVPTAPPASKTPVTKKTAKRPSASKIVNSDTVDLTDDEPPPKVSVRAGNNQVRVVPSHNLMAPQRAPVGTVMNHPRQVYIPISGGQAQNVRPGQTFMLRAINSQNIRQRNVSMNKEPYRRASISSHPAPLPEIAKQSQPPNWKLIPPAPEIKLSKVENGIVISWKLDNYHEENHETIANYQIYAYQETSSPPSTNLWKKIGDVKALPLPMACTLTQFMSGYKYYFAVRAVDIRSRIGPFSSPDNIMLSNK